VSVRRAASALVVASALGACGVKAPPRPPERQAAGAVPAADAAPEPSACDAGCGGSSTTTSTSTSTTTTTKKTSP
jgi:hypothetical protein